VILFEDVLPRGRLLYWRIMSPSRVCECVDDLNKLRSFSIEGSVFYAQDWSYTEHTFNVWQ
jgi:hypothetical protein